MWYTINNLIMRTNASERRTGKQIEKSHGRNCKKTDECEQMRTNANGEKEKCSQKLQNTRTEDSGGCLVVSASSILFLR